MHSIAIVLGAALGLFASMVAPGAVESPDEAAAACERTCDDTESDTDRHTCKLQCRQKAESGPQVIRWKQTRLLGGSPEGGKNAGGTTTTVTTSDKTGETSTTTTVHTHGEEATPGPAVSTTSATTKADPRAALAACQVACNPIAVDGERARCKLSCLHPSKPRATAVAKPVSATPKPAPQPAAR
jgi:hypothetical protein